MKTVYTLAAILALGGALSDYGAARSATQTSLRLAESSTPSTGGHDTARFAEGESSAPSPSGHDSALA